MLSISPLISIIKVAVSHSFKFTLKIDLLGDRRQEIGICIYMINVLFAISLCYNASQIYKLLMTPKRKHIHSTHTTLGRLLVNWQPDWWKLAAAQIVRTTIWARS